MDLPVQTKDPAAVAAAVQVAYQNMFSTADPMFVPRVFGWATDCFHGRFEDFQAVDTRYHDLEHTLQGTLCMARLLHGRHSAGALPRIPERVFQLGILAILLHDTGYLKQRIDTEGTGAKYTLTHVKRSAQFAARLMITKGYDEASILAVQNMVLCTGVEAHMAEIPFQDDMEQLMGAALVTADFLGQMAAADYVEKLPVLYAEFAEASRHAGGDAFLSSFSSAEDLMRRTPEFWQRFVLPRLEREFGGLYRFLNQPYPDGPNEYLRDIEANMRRVAHVA